MTNTNNRNTSTEENKSMAKNELTFDNFISDLAELLDRYRGLDNTPAPAKSKGKASKAKAADPEPEETEGDEGIDFGGEDDKPTMAVRRAALMKQRITTTRKQVLALGYAEDDVKDADKETLVETILAEEYPDEEGDEDADVDVEDDEDVDDDDSDEDEADEDDEDEDEEEDEEDEESDEWTRESLEGLNLRELKRVAKEEFEFEAADLKGQDQETIIAMILGEDAEDEDEDDEDEDDDESDEYTEDELKALTLNELKGLAKEYGIKVKPGMKKAAIVNAILELADEE